VTINANGTGSVTLVVAATGSDNITIVGDRAIQRATDFVTGGDLFANTLNDEFDSLVIFSQQVDEKADRGLKAPVTDPTDVNMVLPVKATRVGTVLAFNATTGNPEAGPSIGSVTTVAAQSANINTVATNIASVNTVAGNSTNINTVAGVSSSVTTVAGISANVTSVAGNASNINTVAGNNANVTTVAGISSSVTSVAGNSTNINAVNANKTNIDTVATNNTNVTTVAGISGNVTTVAGISANVTTVAGISSAVSTVSTNNANVSTVATNIASVNTNASNITAIQNASTNATNAAASAVSAGNAQTAAEAARDATLAAYDNFDDRYLGSKTSNPTLDNDGNALVAGSLYFNSVSGSMQVYTGSAWVAAYVSGSGYLASANNLSDVASTSSARTNLGLGTAATMTGPAGTIVGTTDSQTLTNKTLTAPTLASANITTALTLTGASGTAGQALTSGGSGVAPTWTTVSASQWTTTGSNIYYSTGNVGIGVSSPAYKLDTNGSINANGIEVGLNGDSIKAAGDLYLDSKTSGTKVIFRANTAERGRFSANGFFKATNADYPDGNNTDYHYFNSNVSAGGSGDSVLNIRADSGSFAGYGILKVYSTRTTTNGTFRICAFTNGNGSGACYIADSGNVTNTNNSYGSSSDVKLKENIVDTTPKLEKLMRLRVRNYNLKTKPDEPHIGLIAQETETVFPGLIEESIDYHDIQTTDENGKEVTKNVPTGTTTKSIKYSVFVPMLIKAMQEQQELITAQAATITALTARIVALEAR
jgi:hypothetical protein